MALTKSVKKILKQAKSGRKKTRRTLSKQFEAGEFPTWNGSADDSNEYRRAEHKAQNWTNLCVEPKAGRKELITWLQNNKFSDSTVQIIKVLPDWKLATEGRYAYIANQGFPLTERTIEWMTQNIEEASDNGSIILKEKRKEDREKRKIAELKKDNYVSADAANKLAAYEIVDEVEDYGLILWSTPDLKDWDSENKAQFQKMLVGRKAIVLTMAAERIAALRNELELFGTDKDVTEAYSYLGKRVVNRILKVYDEAINLIDAAKMNKRTVRKPRVAKPKTAANQIKKMNYKERDDELNIVSEDPVNIVGARKVIVFSAKYRKLGIYYAVDEDKGFEVKGTKLQGWDEDRSEQKTLRETKGSTVADKLVAFRKAPYKRVDKVFEELTTTNTKLKGHFGKDTLIVKVYK